MSLERLAHYLGFSKPRHAYLLPLVFLAGALLLVYLLPILVDPYVPGGAPVVQIFLEVLWLFLMVWGLLGHRKVYRERYGEKAYRKMVLHFFFWAGILMIAGALRPIWVEGPLMGWLPLWLRILLGIYLMVVGFLLEFRGVKALGIDQVVLVYTVFPERARHVQSELYQFLRHPLYAALSHVALGIAVLSGTLPGLLCALVFVTKLWIWSKIEEKELVEKFGESYLEYRKKVPAFIPKLKTIKGFFQAIFKWQSKYPHP